jgi:GNAT superfamily N-acetyltransferase
MGSTEPIAIRQASAADVPAMAGARATDEEAGPADPRMTAYLEGRHHPQQALAPRVAFLAEHEDDVVGYIAGHLTERHGCHGEVQYLYVAPAARRAGVGSELLERLAAWFIEHNATKLCVNANLDSPPAVPFYLSRGATPLNRYWYIWNDARQLARSWEDRLT